MMQSRADARRAPQVGVVPDRGALAEDDPVLDQRGGMDAGRHQAALPPRARFRGAWPSAEGTGTQWSAASEA